MAFVDTVIEIWFNYVFLCAFFKLQHCGKPSACI